MFIVPTRDGSNTLFSKDYQATYHSLFGAVTESKHVFLHHGLHTQAARNPISILEFGFGTGLNALLSLKFAIRQKKLVNYTGIETNALSLSIVKQLDYPAYLSSPELTDLFFRMHTEDAFDTDYFLFRKLVSLDEISPEEKFDVIFFDAFAPVHDPEMWQSSVFEKIYQHTSTGGCLVTYCAQGEVRRRLIKAGYKVQRLEGPPGKREMIQAVKA